jgi:hypothetical protein
VNYIKDLQNHLQFLVQSNLITTNPLIEVIGRHRTIEKIQKDQVVMQHHDPIEVVKVNY